MSDIKNARIVLDAILTEDAVSVWLIVGTPET